MRVAGCLFDLTLDYRIPYVSRLYVYLSFTHPIGILPRTRNSPAARVLMPIAVLRAALTLRRRHSRMYLNVNTSVDRDRYDMCHKAVPLMVNVRFSCSPSWMPLHHTWYLVHVTCESRYIGIKYRTVR